MTERTTSILSVGADRYVLRACHRHVDQTVALCSPRQWDYGPIVPEDRVRLLRADDPANPESALGALQRAGLGEHRFDAVHSTDEFGLVAASVLAHFLGCASLDARVALRFRDKALQKEALRRAGVRTAGSVVIDDVHDVSALAGADIGRSVLKPLSFGGAQLTADVAGYDELVAASRALRARNLPRRTFLLEDYQPHDEEWHADGAVFDGELVFLSLGLYGERCLDALDSQRPLWGRTRDPEDEAWAFELAAPFVEEALAALGMTTGVFHMELFYDRDAHRLSFGECAARRGGFLIQELNLYKFNVDLAELGVGCSLGRRPAPDVKVRPGYAGMTFLFGRSGVLVHHPPASEVLAQPGVEYVRFEKPFGSVLSDTVDAIGYGLGLVVLVAETPGELEARIMDLRRWFDERLVVVPPKLTFREHRLLHETLSPEQAKIGGGCYEPGER